MTEQIQSHPTSFEVTKWFGPQTANVMLPDDAVSALVNMTDNIIKDKKSKSHGQSLAGVIDSELRVYKSDMVEAGVDQLLESCVKSYVVHCAKQHGMFKENYVFETNVNSAWVVSQYANEYNPLISAFHVQSQKKIGGFPLFDFFFNAKIRQTKIFVIAEHINSSISGNSFYSTPESVYRDFGVRFGFKWNLFN